MRRVLQKSALLAATLALAIACGKKASVTSSSTGGGTTEEVDPETDDDEVVDVETAAGDKTVKGLDPVTTPPHKDKTKPTVALQRQLDRTVRRAGIVPVSITADGTGSKVAKVSWAYAADGTDFGAETAVADAKTTFDATIPGDTPSSKTARLRVTVTDEGGNAASVTSAPMEVLTQVDLIYGDYEPAMYHNDGPAKEARFNNINGMTSDGTHIYVAAGQVIRRVRLSDGYVETLSGSVSRVLKTIDGIGLEASWSQARACTILNKTLYVTDFTDHVLRAVNIDEASPDFRRVTTIAGVIGTSGSADSAPGPATFKSPHGITNDGTYLYVADAGSHTLRRIDPNSSTVITVIGLAGTTGTANGPGPSARLSSPRDVTYDATTKRLYILDMSNYKIRQYDPATGVVSHFSGLGRQGDTDGTATTARFEFPTSISTDGTFAYVSDIYSHTVRKIALSDGSVTTLAGLAGQNGYVNGTGAAARISYTMSLTYADGKVFIGEPLAGVIRKIDKVTGEVSHFAGIDLGSSPRLSTLHSTMNGTVGSLMPNGRYLVTDNGDDFYLTSIAQTVRHIKLSTNSLTTIAGATEQAGSTDGIGAAARFDNPRGIVKVGGTLYVTDMSNLTIRAIDLTTSAVTTIAGAVGQSGSTDSATGTSARFSLPIAMAADANFLYVHDTNRIRKIAIAPPHAVTTIVGGTAGFVDGNGTSARVNGTVYGMVVVGTNLYIADRTNQAIRKVNLLNNDVTTIAGSLPPALAGYVDNADPLVARFNAPSNITTDGSSLFIYEDGNFVVRAIDIGTGAVTTVAGPGDRTINFQEATGTSARTRFSSLTYANGKVYGVNDTFTLFAVDVVTKDTFSIGPASKSRRTVNQVTYGSVDGPLSAPEGIDSFACAATDGLHLYAATLGGELLSMNFDGTNIQSIAGAPQNLGNVNGIGAAARLGFFTDCGYHDGWVYAVEAYNQQVRRVNVTTGVVETVAGQAGAIGYMDGVGSAARFYEPGRLAIVGDNAYISEQANHTIRKLSLAVADFGTVSTVAGQSTVTGSADGIGTAATFNRPTGMVELNGSLYVADSYNYTIRKINLTTNEVTTVAGTAGSYGLNEGTGNDVLLDLPQHLATDGQDIFITEGAAGVILRLRPEINQVSIFTGKPYGQSGNVDPVLGDAPLQARGSWYFFEGQGFYGISRSAVTTRLH